MEKCMRKRKLRIKEEVAVMDVAYVSTNTRKQALSTAAAESSGPAKRRNVGGGDTEFSSSSSSSSLAEFNRHRQVTENSVSTECLTDSEDQHSSPNSDHVSASSNASMKLLASTDLEEKSVEIENLTCDFDCKESKETTPLCERRKELDKLESTAKPSCHRQSPAAKTPSQAEVEEFFAAAEKMVQKEFADKYNFDVVNDKPLEGRYEWVRLKK